MVELPSLYVWLLKMAGLAVLCGLFYLGRSVRYRHPQVLKYVIIPFAIVIGIITFAVL